MTHREIIEKSSCPICGAQRGKPCGEGAGRLRAEPHRERKVTATGVFGNVMEMLRSNLNPKHPK